MMGARLCIVAVLVIAGCGEAAAPETERRDERASSDAMCVEHGVLEALCTKCNPALIPVFRARGDYCEEHGLPESICPVCHPERGGRPSEALPTDEAPADGTRVRLARPELAEQIGITTEPVVAAPDLVEIAATARIAYDGARVARLNARAPGVIRALHADIGARVEVGAPLVTIASAEVAADRTRAAAARTRLEVAEANLARREGLGEIIAERDLLAARQERDDARAELAALSASIGAVGGGRRGAEYVLTSPIDGVITRRAGAIGSFIGGEEMLIEVADASQLWAEIDVPEADVARVRAGLEVRIEIEGGAALTRRGTLAYVASEIDPHTRTARGRVPLDNADGALRANLFARAFVLAPRDAPAWRVPRGAVQRARGAELVFVAIAPELYEARRVEVAPGSIDPAHVDVRGRLADGERVVVDAAFLLRTETLRDSIGAGCCEEEAH
jgi:cobalt-zinc-cadmium efflux system membrane fusion protein